VSDCLREILDSVVALLHSVSGKVDILMYCIQS
jgi:hypothetical protein